MPSAHLRRGIQERPATCTNSASVTLERSTTPVLPSAGSKARSDTSPHRDTLPWIATPASFLSISSSVSARRSPRTNARPGLGVRPRWLAGKNLCSQTRKASLRGRTSPRWDSTTLFRAGSTPGALSLG